MLDTIAEFRAATGSRLGGVGFEGGGIGLLGGAVGWTELDEGTFVGGVDGLLSGILGVSDAIVCCSLSFCTSPSIGDTVAGLVFGKFIAVS